jgi:predicted RNA binding protein YcfA (HicA-like mRNA interferase family)
MGRMSGIHPERMIRALGRLGWRFLRSGRHQYVLTNGEGRIVTVPMHKGRTLKQGTARAILEQAGVDEDAFFDVY